MDTTDVTTDRLGSDVLADADADGTGRQPAWRREWPFVAGRPATVLATAGFIGVVAAGVVLRFWTRSDLWLDEAQTVNIARLPVGHIVPALRKDGSPPLYYYLLHYWIAAFGTGDVAVRSLSGVFGVACLPLGWFAGRRVGGRLVGAATVLLIATSPFAVRYSTEARMYSLIIFLTLVGFLLLTSSLNHPTKPRLAGVALVSGLLLISHYWCWFLVVSVLIMLAFMSRSDQPRARRARLCLIAVAAGAVLVLPWAGMLLFQLRHTGTPWARPASFSAIINAVSSFAGGGTDQGRGLGLLFFALAAVGLFGRTVDAFHVQLDLRTQPRSRGLGFVSGATLVIAVIAGYLASTTFQARYSSVIFAPFILLVALGWSDFGDVRIRAVVLAAAVAFGFVGAVSNITTNRTQGGVISAAIRSGWHPGDVIAYCPDQLGPGTSRLLPAGYDQITFPRGTGPELVNWVDYAKVNRAGDPTAFARRLLTMAGPTHAVWLVWSPQYPTFEGKCDGLETALALQRPVQAVVSLNSTKYYESANLARYPGPAASK